MQQTYFSFKPIAPLRGLELKRNDPVMWRRLLLLMDHEEERKNEPEYQEMFQVNVINFLRKVMTSKTASPKLVSFIIREFRSGHKRSHLHN